MPNYCPYCCRVTSDKSELDEHLKLHFDATGKLIPPYVPEPLPAPVPTPVDPAVQKQLDEIKTRLDKLESR